MYTANAITDHLGLSSLDFPFSIGESGHFDSIPKIDAATMFEISDISLSIFYGMRLDDTRIDNLFDSFNEIDRKLISDIIIMCDKDKTHYDFGNNKVTQTSKKGAIKFYAIRFKINNKTCEIKSGFGITKFGVLTGNKYEYFRNKNIFMKKIIN